MEQLRKLAVLWHKVGYRDRIVPPKKLACHGCLPRTRCDRMYVRECALEKGVENCGKCENYPYKNVQTAFRQTASSAKKIKQKCSKKEYRILQKAFYQKRKNLDKTNKQ